MDILKTLFDLLSQFANSLFPLFLIGMLATEQRRVRPSAFAKELGISIRKLREIFTLGAPVTKVQGIVWINPEKFYAWLDQFERKGRPGIKGLRGAPKPAEPRNKKDLVAA
jgi:hypothetical protein